MNEFLFPRGDTSVAENIRTNVMQDKQRGTTAIHPTLPKAHAGLFLYSISVVLELCDTLLQPSKMVNEFV